MFLYHFEWNDSEGKGQTEWSDAYTGYKETCYINI